MDDYLESFDPDLRRAYENADKHVDPSLVDYQKVKIKKDSILLSGDSAFYTLQGEGPSMGIPCVFIRLHVCNLRCTWCDAFYTWDVRSPEYWTESHRMGFDECAELLQKTAAGRTNRIVWTGGEPLIQKRQILEVIERLGHTWIHEFETNGTLMPLEEMMSPLSWYRCQFNVSPKLHNSENHWHVMFKPKVIEALNNPTVQATFKFVCRDEVDLNEIDDTYGNIISKDRIYIMPEGIVEQEITKHARQLYEPVLERGWRMTPRFQAIFADGARRGV